MATWRRVAAVAAVATCGSMLAACSNGGNPSASSTTTSKAGSATSIPTQVPNQVSVRKDVQMPNCAASKGGWSAGGTITNSQGHDATYHITVFFTSNQATDLAYATTSVAVPKGQTKPWSAQATFNAPDTVLCVLRGVAAN